MKDYYLIFELAPDVSHERIKEQYHYLAKIFHPDNAKSDLQIGYFEEKMKNIHEAYWVLSDPKQRAEHDAHYTTRQKKLEVSPRILHFGSLIEGEMASNTFIVDYVGTPKEINIDPDVSTPWLQFKKFESIAPPKTFPLEVEIVASAAKLTPGIKYSGVINVSVDDQQSKVSVSLRVKPRPDNTAISLKSFRFRSGEMAHMPEELVPLCDKYWDEGKEYLYDDRHFRSWFIELRRNDVISSLETSRLEKNQDIGLEIFLRSLVPTLESPKISVNVGNTHLGNYDFSSHNLPQPKIEITNHGRGCCQGILEVKSGKWLSVPNRAFAIPPETTREIFFQVNSDQLIWESSHNAKVLLSTNSQNVKTEELEFLVTTPRYPKIVEIETLREEGKWRLALDELNSLRRDGEVNKIADQLEGTILKKKTNFIKTITIFTSIIYGVLGLITGGTVGYSNSSYGYNFWSNYILPMLGLGTMGAVLGPIGANIIIDSVGGQFGKWADYVIGSLAILLFFLAIALVGGILYLVFYVVIFIIAIIIFFAILGGLLGGG